MKYSCTGPHKTSTLEEEKTTKWNQTSKGQERENKVDFLNLTEHRILCEKTNCI